MFFDKRLALTALAMATAAAPGCSDKNDPGTDAVERLGSGSSAEPGTLPAKRLDVSGADASTPAPAGPSAEYKFSPVVDPDIDAGHLIKSIDDDWNIEYAKDDHGNLIPLFTELWARVYYPAFVAGKRYPLLVFMHGNHATCGTPGAPSDGGPPNPRVDNDITYTYLGSCDAPMVPAPSHEGYAYLADDLAASGYIVVSINTNLGINGNPDPVANDPALITARGNLLLKHLERLSQWDRGVAFPAPVRGSIGDTLKDHIDFSQVGMLGHSRGGEGIRAAYNIYRAEKSTSTGKSWKERIVTPVNFAGLFEIGPTDNGRPNNLDPADTPWAVLLPMCDGDVSTLEGMRPFDRLHAYTQESPPSFKSTLTVWGTNHNYYNTEWQTSDSMGCLDHKELFAVPKGDLNGNPLPVPGVTGSAEQRAIAKEFVTAFFRANVGNTTTPRDPSKNALFDPKKDLTKTITDLTRVDRGFLMTPDASRTLVLEDFSKGYATTMSGELEDVSNPFDITVDHKPVNEHAPTLRAGLVNWFDTASASKWIQVHLVPATRTGISLAGFDTLDFRVDRPDPNAEDVAVANGTDPTNFTVNLVNDNDTLVPATPLQIKDFVQLTGPVGGEHRGKHVHSMLQTVRIPLSKFTGATLSSIRGIRFTFDQTRSGALYLANIHATKTNSGAGFLLPIPAEQASASAPLASIPSLAARALAVEKIAPKVRYKVTPALFGQARIASFRASTAGVTPKGPKGFHLAVVSPTPFPVLDDTYVLRVGAVEVDVSRRPDFRDLRRMVFTLTAEQRQLLHGGEDVTVTCGSTQWNLGPLDPALLTP